MIWIYRRNKVKRNIYLFLDLFLDLELLRIYETQLLEKLGKLAFRRVSTVFSKSTLSEFAIDELGSNQILISDDNCYIGK